MLIRSSLGLSFGIVFSVLLFRRRAWPAWVGLGFGAGRAWEECDSVSLHDEEERMLRNVANKRAVIQESSCANTRRSTSAPPAVDWYEIIDRGRQVRQSRKASIGKRDYSNELGWSEA